MDRSFIFKRGLSAAALVLLSANIIAAPAINRTDTGATPQEQCYSANCFSHYMHEQGWMPEPERNANDQLNQMLEEDPTAAGRKNTDIKNYPADKNLQTPGATRDCYTVECYMKYYKPDQQ